MLGFGSKTARSGSRKRLGEILLEHECVSQEDLKRALAQQRREGGLLGRVLVETNLIKPDALLAFLAKMSDASALSLIDYNINSQAMNQLPEEICDRCSLLPIDKLGRILTVAMVDPLDTESLEEAQKYCPDLRVKPMLCSWDDFAAVFKRIYHREATKPENLESRYSHLDMNSLTASPDTAPKKATGDRTDKKEGLDDEVYTGSLDSNGSDLPEEGVFFETPDFEEMGSKPERPGTNSTPNRTPTVSYADFSAGMQELAEAIREGIQEAVGGLATAVMEGQRNQSDNEEIKQLTSTMQYALEGTVTAFADALRKEREALLEKALLIQPQGVIETSPLPSEMLDQVGDRISHTMQPFLEALSVQMEQIGAALTHLKTADKGDPSSSDMVEVLQTAVTESARQSATVMADTLREVLAQANDNHQSQAPIDPIRMAEMIRDGVGAAVGNALEAMSSQMQAQIKLQQNQITSMPPEKDVHVAAQMLQQQLTTDLDTRLETLAEHFQVVLEESSSASARHIETLAEVIRESVLSAVAASVQTRTEQQDELTRIVENSLSTITHGKSTGGEGLTRIAEAILSAIQIGRASSVEQQRQMTSVLEKSLAALASERTGQQDDLTRVVDAIMAAIEAGKVSLAEQQQQLTKMVETSLTTVVAEKNAQQGELTRVTEAILSAIEVGRASSVEQQRQMTSILEESLSALSAAGNMQQVDLAPVVDAITGAVEAGQASLAEQQQQLAKMVETSLTAVVAEQNTQQGELTRVAEAILSSIEVGRTSSVEQQHQMTTFLEKSLSALSAEKTMQQGDLTRIADAITGAIETGKVSLAEQQQQLAKMVETTVGAVVAERNAQQGELARIAEAILSAIEVGRTSSAEQQQQLAAILGKSLSAERAAQQGELVRVADAILSVIASTEAAQSGKQDQLTQVAQAALESVRQTAQLLEAHSVAENSRSDLLRRRQSQHASVTPFNPEGMITSEAYTAEDTRVREGLDSECPLNTLTFDNYFAGETNTFTVNLAQAIAKNPGGEYNPLFLYGAVGLGKTHLISAIGNAILANASTKKKQIPVRVGYISASHFSRRLAAAIADDALELFRDNYCLWDVLILDDIQFLGGRVEAQEEFFHIFNVLLQAGRQIVIAGDKPPDKLGLLEQRLVSRFASGIVVEVKAPDWETRMKILRHIAESGKMKISEDVLSLVALRVADDIRKMTGALRKIIAYARIQGNVISMDGAQSILSHLSDHQSV